MAKHCEVNDTVMIPFAPSAAAASVLLRGEQFRPKQGKEFARTKIAGEMLLTVPVVGGASRLKHLPHNLSEIIISDHGSWRREHLGALNAAYGKTPFFSHIYPLIEEAYKVSSYGSLAEFNEALWKIVTDFLDIENIRRYLNDAEITCPGRFNDIKEELKTKVNLNYSIFDALFRLGKNTVFIL